MIQKAKVEALLSILLLFSPCLGQIVLPGPNISIWSFTTNDSTFEDYATLFYNEINSTLNEEKKCIRIVTRDELASFIMDVRSEDEVAKIVEKFTSLKPEKKDTLEFLRATSVMHGHLHVNNLHGTVNVIIKYQLFTGQVITVNQEVVKNGVFRKEDRKALIDRAIDGLCVIQSIPANIVLGGSIAFLAADGHLANMNISYRFRKLAILSLGIEGGQIGSEYESTYDTLPGLGKTKSMQKSTDYYAAVLAMVSAPLPITFKRRHIIPSFEFARGYPSFRQFRIGFDFEAMNNLLVGLKFTRVLNIRGTQSDIEFDPYGNSGDRDTRKNVDHTAFGLTIHFGNP